MTSARMRTLKRTFGAVAIAGLFAFATFASLNYLNRSVPPPTPYTRISKAHCGPKITHVNVVFWGGNTSNNKNTSSQFDGFSQDREMDRVARNVVNRFWSGKISVIRTNDYSNVIPKHLGQLVIHFYRERNAGIGVFGIVYDSAKMREKILKSMEDGVRPFDAADNSARILRLDGDFEKRDDFKFFISSLNDIVSGRCDRIMSDSITSDSSFWKFFPPYERFNGRDGIGDGIAK